MMIPVSQYHTWIRRDPIDSLMLLVCNGPVGALFVVPSRCALYFPHERDVSWREQGKAAPASTH